MRKLLITLSGARPEVLQRCPSERGKFEGIGGAVLTTAVLAFISMTFALSSALGLPLLIAIPAALLWGLAILSLDRWLVGTMQADDGGRRWPIALPRILMAVLLGFVISTPLVLQIFKSEIDAQLVQIKQQRANEFAARQDAGTIGAEVARLRKEADELQKVIISKGEVPLDPSADPKIKALIKERDLQQRQARKFYDEWQCQLYGGANCPRKGDGPLAKTSKADFDKARARVDQLNRQIEKRRKDLAAADESARADRLRFAEEEWPKVQAQFDAAIQRQNDLQAAFDAENRATNGLLIRLQALNEVSSSDPTLRVTHLLLFLLFLLIECLPITVKLMQRPGNYEKVLALAAKSEYREARAAYGPTLGSVPPPAGAVNGGEEQGRTKIWDIWDNPQPGRTAPPSPPPGTPLPDRTLPLSRGPLPAPADPPAPSGDGASWDHDMLRAMPGTPAHRPNPSGSERGGSFELFPEDD